MQYLMIIEKATDGQLWGYFPDVLGCTTAGATVEEVRANAVDALEGHLEDEEVPAARPLKAILEEGLELDGSEVFAWVSYERHAEQHA